MIPIEMKIIITSLILWFITHFAAFPGTPFADWAEKKLGSYSAVYEVIATIYGIPIVITVLYWLWTS